MSLWKQIITGSLGWIVCGVYAALLLGIEYSNITIFIMLVLCLLTITITDIRQAIRSSVPIQLLIAFFLLHLIGLLYSENIPNAWFVLEKKLTLILFPVLVFPALRKLPDTEKHAILFRIGWITIAGSLLFLLVAIFKKMYLHDELAFHRDHFASIHYVFYSIYFATGTLFLIHRLNDRPQSVKKVAVMLGVVLYSIGILIIISSKTGIAAYTIGLVCFLYEKLPSRRLFYLSGAGIVLAFIILLAVHPVTLERFKELPNNLSVLKIDKLTDPEEFTGLNLRLYFWKISLTQLWDEGRMLTGVGTGDAQDFLNKTYELHNLDDYGYSSFDPHSQWVMTLIQLGVPGLGVFAGMFFLCWRGAFRVRNYDFLFFIWIIFAFSFTESVLESNKGIVFFALFYCILCSLMINKVSPQK